MEWLTGSLPPTQTMTSYCLLLYNSGEILAWHVPCPPLANSRVSARRSPGWGGGDGRQVTVIGGGGDCKGISRQTVVPSTDASKENTCEATFWDRTWSPGENILGLK